MANENVGCFAWCVRFKKPFNERWARFRNRFRRRFYARRGETLDPSTVLNETGTSDMVLSKTQYSLNKLVPATLSPRTTTKEVPVFSENVPASDVDEVFDKLVEEFVAGVITVAADALLAETQQLPCSARFITVNAADDNVSLSSSIISHIADTAVADSLTNIIHDSDRNQSADNGSRPRTVKEFMSVFGIAEEAASDGLPDVSE